jgi:uncharacterized coiled-coil protein SlyX
MSTGDRAGLIARISQVRRLTTVRDRAKTDTEVPEAEQIRRLETRVAHLEQLLEGLQDSVYRESERHAKLIVELQAQLQPGALNAALAEDARNRGL